MVITESQNVYISECAASMSLIISWLPHTAHHILDRGVLQVDLVAILRVSLHQIVGQQPFVSHLVGALLDLLDQLEHFGREFALPLLLGQMHDLGFVCVPCCSKWWGHGHIALHDTPSIEFT